MEKFFHHAVKLICKASEALHAIYPVNQHDSLKLVGHALPVVGTMGNGSLVLHLTVHKELYHLLGS